MYQSTFTCRISGGRKLRKKPTVNISKLKLTLDTIMRNVKSRIQDMEDKLKLYKDKD